MEEVLPFVHPFLGALALLGTSWVGSRGLVARQGGPKATRLRRFHARWGLTTLVGMVVAALTGTATVAFVRDDLDVAGSWHFWWGWLATACMAGLAWATPRRFRGRAWVQNGHPVVGALVLMLGVLVMVVGIGLLP